VTARFEVDDPTLAVHDESAVETHVLEHVAVTNRQRELRPRVVVRAEHEAALRVLERRLQSRDDSCGGSRDLALLDAQQPQLLRVDARAPLDRSRGYRIDARFRDPL
jgi:hypothetical protein